MPHSLLRRSAQEGARFVALGYLGQAGAALDRWDDPEVESPLHDFRVGVRRLRSCVRAYRPVLGDAVGKKARHRLEQLSSMTNPGRDAEVALAWLSERSPWDPSEQPGIDWLTARLERERDAAYRQVRAESERRFRKLEARLRERLRHYTALRVVGEREPTFAEVTAVAMLEQHERLESALRRVEGVRDEALIHRGRIHGKRLRYIIEPLRGELAGAREVVRRLKALQDLLGELNDLRSLAAIVSEALGEPRSDPSPESEETVERKRGLDPSERTGLLRLLTRIRSERSAVFDRWVDAWMGPQGLLDRLGQDVATLASRMRTEAAMPRNLELPSNHVEIERKYLLNALPPACRKHEALEILQGYLPGQELIERVRSIRTPVDTRFVRTVKFGRGVERLELEESCSREVFETLFTLTEGRRLRKRRYVIEAPEEGLAWEIDQFLDRELCLAEIELPSAGTEVTLPEWLAPYVEREVTDDPAYVNRNLAR